MSLWYRVGWVGKTLMVAAGLWGLGWLAGQFGMVAVAQELGSAAIVILSVLATLLVLRTIWYRHAAGRGGNARK
jgi:hypothetical protein